MSSGLCTVCGKWAHVRSNGGKCGLCSAEDVGELLTPGEVAKIFRVDPKTVTRWGKEGKLRRVRTPGGHSRYLKLQVMSLARGEEQR